MGFCRTQSGIFVSFAGLHRFEEPIICKGNGSGTVFFSGCSLRCIACQNYVVSQQAVGEKLSPTALSDLFLSLQEQGATNINLVTPTHQAPWICEALDIARPKLHVPVIWNTSGYETRSAILALRDYVDIFLTDLKFYSPALSSLFSSAPDYFQVAVKALREMVKMRPLSLDADGNLRRGVIVRHLMLPGQKEDTLTLLEYLREHFSPNDFYLSLMRQYTPCYKAKKTPPFHRPLTSLEYKKAVQWLEASPFNGYIQDKDAVGVEYVPPFNSSENGLAPRRSENP
ncbi:MAG: radical SAM protein [Clostridia bacterium]|nr:radical SAM protein [Clostridia bacterium]